MVRFVLGRACSGKSRYIVEAAAKESLQKKVIIIVPEQFSFETERAVLHTDEYNNDNIHVMSFTKLYYEISKLLGLEKLPVVTDGERMLLTDMALKASVDSLNVFAKFVNYPDFCIKVAQVIRDFKLAGVSSDDILSVSDKIGGACGAKLRDIAVVSAAYDSLILEKFIDPSDHLTRLYNLLEDFDYFANTSVYFDSYTGFTGQQYNIIKRIIKSADNVTFSFCTDNIDDTEINVFYNINKTARRIKEISADYGNEIADENVILLDKNYYNSDTLRSLEVLFAKEQKPNINADKSLSVYSCTNPKQETFAATSLIKMLVNSGEYRYRDFIVVARNADDYKNYFELFSKKNNIQCFLDKKVCLTDTILYVYINSLLQLGQSLSTENILNYLKCGFHEYDNDDIYYLENYVFVWNISEKDWANEWTMSPKGLSEYHNDKDEEYGKELLSRINALRADVFSKISKFRAAYTKNAENRIRAIYEHIISQKADKRLSEICDKYELENDHFSASVLRQAWDALMKVFNSIARMYDNSISSFDFLNAVKISCSAVFLSNVPQMLDEVTFGSADRIRPSKPKISILLGANQGIFPNNTAKNGILSPSDKKKLKDFDLDLNDDAIKSAVEENYLVYSMTCCPIDKTIIFYSEKTLSGEKLEPSSFVDKIISNYDEFKVKVYSGLDNKLLPQTEESALYMMADLFDDDFLSVKESFAGNNAYQDKLSSFDKNTFEDNLQVSSSVMDTLYSDIIGISPSQFDIYHTCKFRYLMQYALNFSKIEKVEMNSREVGNYVHDVLENLFNKYHKGISNLTDQEINDSVDQLIKDYLSKFTGADILLTPRYEYMLSRISDNTKDVVKHLRSEFKQNEFDPMYCEFNITKSNLINKVKIPLDKGEILLKGKIDRVDIYKGKDFNAVRVVDYKSKGKDFSLNDTLIGLNMQMIIYLYALVKNSKPIVDKPVSAGVLYMPGKRDENSKKFTMNGMILDDDTVIDAMDKARVGDFIPKVSDQSHSFVDAATIECIFNNIEKQMKEMGNTIRSGNLLPDPVKLKSKQTSCTYCNFKNVCRSSDMQMRKKPNHRVKNKIVGILKGDENNGVSADK